jgi:hypothetical protein
MDLIEEATPFKNFTSKTRIGVQKKKDNFGFEIEEEVLDTSNEYIQVFCLFDYFQFENKI